jgi:hypothetical protein
MNGDLQAVPDKPEEREPYVALLMNVKTNGTFWFPIPEGRMDELVKAWGTARADDAILTIDAGAQGCFEIVAADIIFFKRITQAEINEINATNQRMQNLQRLAAAGLRT